MLQICLSAVVYKAYCVINLCNTLTLPSFLPSLQAEETKVLRLQVELSQAKGELERRIQEKEEETEVTRYHSFLH